MAKFPSNEFGGSVAYIPIHPDTKIDSSGRSLTSAAMRSHLLSDEEIASLRSIDSEYMVGMRSDTSDVDIYDHDGTLIAIAPDLQKAIVLIKAIYAASRHTWTSKQLDRERRIAFRHGVTIMPGMTLDECELAYLPPRAVVEVDGRVLQRNIRGWVTQRGNKAEAPTYGTFLGVIDRYFEAPFEDYDDDDDDDGADTGCP